MPHDHRLEQLRQAIEPHRLALLEHPLYESIDQLPALRVFMQHHVYAVWDFMSLLKRLQADLTGASQPWLPPADPLSARLINEIVLGEETDERPDHGYASHYDLYLSAMRACGADCGPIESLVERLRGGQLVRDALADASVEPGVAEFVGATFDLVEHGATHEVAAAFTFGREDLLPDVFRQIVANVNRADGGLDEFEYYLGRHIELDGDHHGPMAERLVASVCQGSDDKWREAERAAVGTLRARLALWDSVCARIRQGQPA